MTEAFAHAVLARDETLRGRAEDARARALASEARVIANGAGMALPLTRTELARAEAALGNLDRAHELLEVVVAGGADSGWMLCQALLALADALADAALTQHLELGARAWLPQTLDTLAQIAAGLESWTEAARLLGAAERGRSELGVVRWGPDAAVFDELARALEQRLGAEASAVARTEGAALPMGEAIGWVRRARGTRRRPAAGWESLTPTEAQVVELVAQGLTNPQVAERMFILRSTVKVHVAHIFQKLDVSSRSELAAMAVRRGGL